MVYMSTVSSVNVQVSVAEEIENRTFLVFQSNLNGILLACMHQIP